MEKLRARNIQELKSMASRHAMTVSFGNEVDQVFDAVRNVLKALANLLQIAVDVTDFWKCVIDG